MMQNIEQLEKNSLVTQIFKLVHFHRRFPFDKSENTTSKTQNKRHFSFYTSVHNRKTDTGRAKPVTETLQNPRFFSSVA